jgi:hypothetical protein
MNNKLVQTMLLLISAIIGAVLGYLGALAGAQAQIEAAKINIYGPIYTTQTAEAKAAPVSANVAGTSTITQEGTTLEIEKIPLDVFAYGGNDNPDGGFGTFVLINNSEIIPNYKLDYFLPGDKRGYAGLAFNFHEGANLSTYHAIEVVVLFSSPLDEIDLYVKDLGGSFNTIRVVGNGGGEMTLRYEFKNFPNINFNAVKEIGLVASTEFITGAHQVVVKQIRFVGQ